MTKLSKKEIADKLVKEQTGVVNSVMNLLKEKDPKKIKEQTKKLLNKQKKAIATLEKLY